MLCNILTALSAVDNRVSNVIVFSVCVCSTYPMLKLSSVFAADLADAQIQTRTHSLERCVVSGLDIITILLNRSFRSDECVCNETGNQRDMILSLCAVHNK